MNRYEDEAIKAWKPWYEQDYRPLINSTKEALLWHMEDLLKDESSKKVRAYGVYTCSGLSHISVVMDLVSDDLNGEMMYSDDEDLEYLKYCPDEWTEQADLKYFEKPNKIIEDLHEQFEICSEAFEDIYQAGNYSINEESEHYDQRNVENIFDAILQAMKELSREGRFSWMLDDQLVLVWFSDPSDSEFDLSAKSVQMLNKFEVFEEFCDNNEE
ncbi:DUF4303 domain-containing protein [Aureibacter tunicatorum]|uniref:DUF4303 domain-containing protein n=1 Tax=Aureibacter tunicatorum TaxID=866807 RepID=A0AAE3XPH5_9BACT|nr:DUF4303 domain-containing protein [Aureibacter tunicatorum]MDR6238879.1 hypothetical protein [Aureibacter tunicatorum]